MNVVLQILLLKRTTFFFGRLKSGHIVHFLNFSVVVATDGGRFFRPGLTSVALPPQLGSLALVQWRRHWQCSSGTPVLPALPSKVFLWAAYIFISLLLDKMPRN